MTPEEKVKENQEWLKTEEGKRAHQKLTGDRATKEEYAEMDLVSAIRHARGVITLKDQARILKENYDPADLGSILRDLLIKNQEL